MILKKSTYFLTKCSLSVFCCFICCLWINTCCIKCMLHFTVVGSAVPNYRALSHLVPGCTDRVNKKYFIIRLKDVLFWKVTGYISLCVRVSWRMSRCSSQERTIPRAQDEKKTRFVSNLKYSIYCHRWVF